MYDTLKKSLKEMQQPLSQGEKNFKGLHNPVDHVNLVPGVTDQEHVFNGVTKPQENNFPSSYKSGEDVKKYDSTITKSDDDNEVGYDIPVILNKEEKWIGKAIKKPGSLHKELGVPEGEKIPADKMAAATHAPGKLGKRARLAHTLKKMHKEANMSHSLGDHEELRRYAHEHGGIDRDDMLQAAHHIEHGHHEGLKSKLRKMDTDPRDFVLGHVHKKHWSGLGYTPMREEAEQIDELSKKTLGSYIKKAGGTSLDSATAHALDNNKKKAVKRATGVEKAVDKMMAKEEVEQVAEVITKKTSMGDVIADFVHSKNPKFAGKSKKERMKQAMAAYYSKQRNEAYEDNDYVSDEVSMVRTELKAIMAKAQDMLDKMPTNMHIEPWVQSKIATAKEMVSGVHDYMVYGDDKDTAPAAAAPMPYTQSGQMASNYGNFMNRMGEEVELDEAKRGRPRKNASSSDSEVEGGADMHPMMQARKVISLRGQHTFTHKSGESYKMEPSMAHKILAHHDNLKTAEHKQEFADRVAHSKAEMHNALAGKPAVKKPKVSLGSMKKEDVNPKTMQSARGPMSVQVRTVDGKLQLVKTKGRRKELDVTSEELVGGQKKLDANHNGKLDKMDFKILRSKKKAMKEAEEMTAANVAKAAATQVVGQTKGDASMQKDSVEKINQDPLAKKKMAEEVLERLYDTLSEENKTKFDEMLGSQEGIDTLLAFAEEHGI
jgi:hypothetical protein